MNSVLHPVKSRLARWLAAGLALFSLGLAAWLVLLAVLLDAALDLSDGTRVAAPFLGGFLIAGALGWGILVWRRRLGEQRMARSFEQTDPALGNRLINAVQLSAGQGATPVQEYLRTEAVELGRKAAASLRVWPTVRAAVRFALSVAAGGALAWVVLALLGPDLLRCVWPRLVDPRGDHPPYSRLKLEVSPGAAEILYGGQMEVRARASGRPADKLWLVAKTGTNVARTIMFLAPDKSFFQALANLREPAEYFVTDGQARSHRYPIRIRYTPQITLVELTAAFPPYTGKSGTTARLSDDPQALPEGTRLSFRVASNRPLKSGSLDLTPVLGGKPTRVVLTPEMQQSNIVSGSFVLAEPVVFTISVQDISGLSCADPRQGRFNLLPDERPQLFVLEPGRDAVATPSIRVPVRVEAQDDYGITRVVWLRGLNRSIERPFNLKLELKGGPQSVQSAGAFECDKLGVRPGDIIEYYFEAADNYPKGPNLTLSRLYRLEIISQEQYEAILRQAAARKALFEPYFQLGGWLGRLAERARNLEKQSQAGSEAQRQAAAKEAEAIAEELAKYERELGKLLQQATLFDVEQAFRSTLVDQHTRIGQARKSLAAGMGSGQLDPKKMAEVADALRELAQAERDEVGEPGQQIAGVARVLARADKFVKLAQQQATLAQMLRRFADKSGDLSRVEQIEMQELTYQERRIQGELRSLLESLPELLANLPAGPQFEPLRKDVNGFIQAVAEAKIEADLTDTSKFLAALDGKEGHPLAQRAAEKMDRLIAKCGSDLSRQGEQCLRFRPRLQQAMGKTLEQILGALGANTGSGQGGRDGYGLFNDDVALYGPNVELAGEQAGGRNDRGGGSPRRAERLAGDARDPGSTKTQDPGRVRLQPDARFPLRYRDLVGDYFKVIAESESQPGEKR